jgi:hypothetical protein
LNNSLFSSNDSKRCSKTNRPASRCTLQKSQACSTISNCGGSDKLSLHSGQYSKEIRGKTSFVKTNAEETIPHIRLTSKIMGIRFKREDIVERTLRKNLELMDCNEIKCWSDQKKLTFLRDLKSKMFEQFDG